MRMGKGRGAIVTVLNTCRKTVVIGQKGFQAKRGMFTENKMKAVLGLAAQETGVRSGFEREHSD
jgi:methyl coenzyme M reductase subunit C